MINKSIQYVLCLLLFIIPVAWWTRLNANYYSTKLTLLFLAGGIAWLVIPRKIALPRFPRPMLFSLLVIVFFQIAYHTFSLSLDDVLFISKFVSFAALVFWIYSLNIRLEKVFEKLTYIIFLTVASILAITLFEFYNSRINNLSTDVSVFLGTFGNVNMFAEFFVLTLPFLFQWSRHEDKIPKVLKLLLLSAWIFFILYCSSRSAWIGLLLFLVALLRYQVSKKELAFVFLSFLLYFSNVYLPSQVNQAVAVKGNSFKERLGLYEATVELIKDHPWGIKAGSFMGEVELYQMNSDVKPSEFTYFDQPHSEFLKWGAQFGWLFLFSVLVLFFTVFFLIGKWFFLQEQLFFVQVFLVLLPQMLFQFPFENPASILCLSLFFGLFFREFASEKTVVIPWFIRPVFIGLFLFGLYSSVGFLNSVYQESTNPRTDKIISACEYYPINLRACHAKLNYFLESKQFEKFTTHFKEDFAKEPFFVDYLRLLPTYYSVKQNSKKTCESLFLYKTIFPHQTAFNNKYYEDCRGFANTFYFEDPAKFKAKYLTWLDGLN